MEVAFSSSNDSGLVLIIVAGVVASDVAPSKEISFDIIY